MRRYFSLKSIGGCFYVAVCSLLVQSTNSSAESTHSSDDSLIREQAAEYAKAFASGNVESLSNMWGEKAIFVDQFGNVYRGRTAIKNQYANFFLKNGGVPLEVKIESIEFPSTDIAVEEGTSRIANSSSPSAMGHYVATHVKRDGKWLMESVTESPFQAANNGEYLKPLDWMIGNWKVDGPNGTVRLKTSWANNNVMACESEAVPKDGTRSSHTEFIYWNPQMRCISSWQIDGQGSVSRKWWQKSGDNWIIHASSTQFDGANSRADYIIKPVDNDSFTWRSTNRSISGMPLPDTETIKMTRIKS